MSNCVRIRKETTNQCTSNPSDDGENTVEDTIFNDDSTTCVYVYTVSYIALCMGGTWTNLSILGNKSGNDFVHNPKSILRVQPLLPMMKIATGTVSLSEELLWDNVTFVIEMLHSCKAMPKDGVQTFGGVDLADTFSTFELIDTFPYTGKLVAYNELGYILDLQTLSREELFMVRDIIMDGTMDEFPQTILREISLFTNSSHASNMTVVMLAFMAHMASYPCIRYFEILHNS